MANTTDTIPKTGRFSGYTGKMIVVGILVVICWVASLLVLGVVSERQNREAEVGREVAEQWGRPQLVAGPVVVVPFYKTERGVSGITENVRKVLYILPKDLSIASNIKPELRSRGIFSAPVYRADFDLSGTFTNPDLVELGIPASSLLWAEATMLVGLSDTRSIGAESVRWNGDDLALNPGAALWSINGMGIHSQILWNHNLAGQKFDIKISVAGSKGISYLPLGDNTQVSATAPWGSPSFVGAYLPTSEELTKDNFTATWNISSLGRSYPSAWEAYGSGVRLITNDFSGGNFFGMTKPSPLEVSPGGGESYEQALASSAFGVNLFREVTFYTLVSRTVKYAILFIALTFLAFYLFEIVAGLRVHPFQYLLIGAGLVLFYLLLLSFSEHVGFGRAYLLSVIMTMGLVTSYSAGVLKARKRAWMIAAILAVLYAYLYAVLQLESYALLFGTLFLFIALAAVMRATRKIEWYKEVE